MRPGPDVLASFGVSADPVSLPGDPAPSTGLDTVARTGQPVTALVLALLA